MDEKTAFDVLLDNGLIETVVLLSLENNTQEILVCFLDKL